MEIQEIFTRISI